jgi:hypothetical protein
VSEEKFSKCEEGGGIIFKYGISGVRKKKNWKESFRRKEKKSKCFLWRKRIFVVREKLKLGKIFR